MTDHAELLWRRAASLRASQRRTDEDSEELAAAVRAAYNDGMRKADILRATGHIWSRTWVDRILNTTPETKTRPVVLAVITSERGVLIGKRNDGTPPWTFPGGEMRPGEVPVATAVREVNEETGLVVEPVAHELGRRMHPTTKSNMIYLACVAANGLDVTVADRDELAEVKWASLDEAERLMPDMFDVVREYLRREVRS